MKALTPYLISKENNEKFKREEFKKETRRFPRRRRAYCIAMANSTLIIGCVFLEVNFPPAERDENQREGQCPVHRLMLAALINWIPNKEQVEAAT